MPKFANYTSSNEIKDMMFKVMKAFPREYPNFDPNLIHCVHTMNKKSKKVYKLRGAKYPEDTLHGFVYILEIFNERWKTLSEKKKYHVVNKIMMSIPDTGFLVQDDEYGKLIKHDFELYEREVKYTNKVHNWLEDDTLLPDLFTYGTVMVDTDDSDDNEDEESDDQQS